MLGCSYMEVKRKHSPQKIFNCCCCCRLQRAMLLVSTIKNENSAQIELSALVDGEGPFLQSLLRKCECPVACFDGAPMAPRSSNWMVENTGRLTKESEPEEWAAEKSAFGFVAELGSVSVCPFRGALSLSPFAFAGDRTRIRHPSTVSDL